MFGGVETQDNSALKHHFIFFFSRLLPHSLFRVVDHGFEIQLNDKGKFPRAKRE
jgi:hypothetical protein